MRIFAISSGVFGMTGMEERKSAQDTAMAPAGQRKLAAMLSLDA
jgi:hypothetical protein